jgi:hypothetical protein
MLTEQFQEFARSIPAEFICRDGLCELRLVVAERKAFLTRRKLEYRAKMRIDAAARLVKFTEQLIESSSGLSSGDSASGFGFKAEIYSIRGKERLGSIEEQSSLFGKKYSYSFDFGQIRPRFEQLSSQAGYVFKYQITPAGL